MSHSTNNIYHGRLNPDAVNAAHMAEPVSYAPVGGRLAHDDAPYIPRRDSYPDLAAYGQHDYRMPPTQGLNLGVDPQLEYQPSFPAQLSQGYTYPVPYQGQRENSMPYAFPGQSMPHPSSLPNQLTEGPSMPPLSRSYPVLGHYSGRPGDNVVNLQDTNIFDDEMPSGQPLPDPGEFLRIKLGLKPGEDISLWSLPDPEPGQRPPHSYPLLVRLAIYGSPNQRATLKQIYEAIEARFEYYRNQPKGAWKGSIRHNLSLNQVFRNVHRPLTEPGKGNYWEIDHSKGEGYKRDRKRKSRKGKEARSRSEDFDDDDDFTEADFGMMMESDQSDSSRGSRVSSSRANRRVSPYSSPSHGTSRRLEASPRLQYSTTAGMRPMPSTSPADQYFYQDNVGSSPEGSPGYLSGGR
ncbi:hypothetical protein EST38_g7082 [Candolleomyces aberdarensis]|uniref:Fork-head domain-containing protein n=1 Tax=Candolleomyces aberdarensis TaxID=2316362 RepID=A0A4Q2DJC2_9AGAR|nr:hypothetical protein EST38_g7082 [Candolleomyces aberdarensis]